MIYTIGYRDERPPHTTVIEVTSRSKTWTRQFSPFFLGPCKIPTQSEEDLQALNMENAWQYSKVYQEHLDGNSEPSKEWFRWARTGFAKERADRYPMGRGAYPAYSYWDGQKLGYVDARQQIYIPLYSQAIREHKLLDFLRLRKIYEELGSIAILDFDAYRYDLEGMDLKDVILRTDKKMGHGFVLAMMLEELI